MSLFRFLTSRTFFIQLVLAVILLIVLLFVAMKGLEKYTRHGQSEPVPDFTGMVPAEAGKIAARSQLKIEVVDSLYMDDAAPGAVVDQVPRPGHGVKQNRTIFLTINSVHQEMVTLPKLTDISLRQAQVLIENSGMLIGNITYHPSEFNNLVLKAQFNTQDILRGKQLPKGSRIDLVVGRQTGTHTTLLPDLTGRTVEDALYILDSSVLGTGVIIYDASVFSKEDSLNARIWKQRPNPKSSPVVLLGSSVDLWVTIDPEKLDETPETESD